MTMLHFTKMHGLGNDFVVVDALTHPFTPTPVQLARLCDRRFGIGCDQVLVVAPPTAPDVDFDYRIYNADGSEVGQCGNGARALAVFLAGLGRLQPGATAKVQTRTARMALQLLSDGQVMVNMGVPRLAAAEVPVALVPSAAAPAQYRAEALGTTWEFVALSMGNPHAVLRVPDVHSADVAALGPALQARREWFTEGVNVGFLAVHGRDRGSLRVYERGSGETLACGSGACAAFVAGRLWGDFDAIATLQLLGGSLRLSWDGPGHPVWMTGPAEAVYTGVYPLSAL